MVCKVRSFWKARRKNGNKKIQYLARAQDIMIMKVRIYQWMPEQMSAFTIPARVDEYYTRGRDGLARALYGRFRAAIQSAREKLAEIDPWIDTANRFTHRPEQIVQGHVEVTGALVRAAWAQAKPVRGDPRSGGHDTWLACSL